MGRLLGSDSLFEYLESKVGNNQRPGGNAIGAELRLISSSNRNHRSLSAGTGIMMVARSATAL